eukprot:CAMPEP_0180463112 /NCGR_PEP_ID=MMETSP1036_2-20121128/24758_1 /TAXON_ID=632150 /ORGANISM="Azadinium spinosum, Strain 3D9" /LENGTH=34 /DNA_ID= /DNA_START= /DNA_END= /DNA_ORIENTATION=
MVKRVAEPGEGGAVGGSEVVGFATYASASEFGGR